LSGKGKNSGGFNPVPPEPTRLTIDELQKLGVFFKQLIDSSNLRWAVVAAGIAAILEIFHIGWLAARYIFRF